MHTQYWFDIVDNNNNEVSVLRNLKERNVNNIFAYKSFCWCKNVIIVELLTVMTYIVTNCITVLLLIIYSWNIHLVSFLSAADGTRWCPCWCKNLRILQNRKCSKQIREPRFVAPKLYILYTHVIQNVGNTLIISLYTFKNYVKINWIHKISMKLILRFSFDDWFSIYVAMCNF